MKNDSIWKFITTVLATALLSSVAWWFAVGNKLHACEEAVELKEEFAGLQSSLDANTKALNRMNMVLSAHGITMENLAPRTRGDGP